MVVRPQRGRVFLTAGFLAIMYYFIPNWRSGRFIPIVYRSFTSGR